MLKRQRPQEILLKFTHHQNRVVIIFVYHLKVARRALLIVARVRGSLVLPIPSALVIGCTENARILGLLAEMVFVMPELEKTTLRVAETAGTTIKQPFTMTLVAGQLIREHFLEVVIMEGLFLFHQQYMKEVML